MLIFDAHLDLAWNAVEWNRNLELPAAEIRRFEQHFSGEFPGPNTVTYPDLVRGGIGVVVATLLPRLHRRNKELTFYQSREAAHGAALGQLAYYRALSGKGVLRELPDAATLTAHVDDWQSSIADTATNTQRPPVGYILSMEGAPPILFPKQVEQWYDWGLRIVGPAHYGPNEYCHGTGSVGGLSDDGRHLLREMNRVGMLLDATHLSDDSFWEALDIYTGPVLASHHNCRALIPGDRQLSDDQIRALVARGAVIGAAFDNWMLTTNWKKTVTPRETVKLEHVADHIDHICQLAGNARHSGIGTDLDGGFGAEQSPSDMDTIADIPRLLEILSHRGYSDADVERIAWRNFVEFFSNSL
ncbi:MAG: dipeptidase [Planctomycetaceae bacterium]